jgi:peptidyl-prolyl cis-trans isomerase C
MLARLQGWVMSGVFVTVGTVGAAQVPPPAPPPAVASPAETAPPANAVAATVNGQPIPELAVFRGLTRVPPANRDQVRTEILSFLIENTIIDQYLAQLKVTVDPKDIDAHVQKLKDEAKKDNQDFTKMLAKLHLTEDDLRRELHSALRWDKFVLQQGTDKALQDLFDHNKVMFDGTRVQARHILISIKEGKETAESTALAIKKQIEGDVAQQLAKLPPGGDELARAKERARIIDKAFAGVAAEKSTCPSKAQGGDLGYFPRIGAMVEPFAKVAFTLKPYQVSDPVATEFGYHLIMPLDQKPGKDVKFDDVKPFVREVYGDRLREAIINQYKPRSQIVITEQKK